LWQLKEQYPEINSYILVEILSKLFFVNDGQPLSSKEIIGHAKLFQDRIIYVGGVPESAPHTGL
jgi:hypothetical protein